MSLCAREIDWEWEVRENERLTGWSNGKQGRHGIVNATYGNRIHKTAFRILQFSYIRELVFGARSTFCRMFETHSISNDEERIKLNDAYNELPKLIFVVVVIDLLSFSAAVENCTAHCEWGFAFVFSSSDFFLIYVTHAKKLYAFRKPDSELSQQT